MKIKVEFDLDDALEARWVLSGAIRKTLDEDTANALRRARDAFDVPIIRARRTQSSRR